MIDVKQSGLCFSCHGLITRDHAVVKRADGHGILSQILCNQTQYYLPNSSAIEFL